MAISVMSITLLSLFSLLYTIIAGSAVHRATVRAGERASQIAEGIDRLYYIGCPGADAPGAKLYESALQTTGGKFNERIAKVEFLQDRSAKSSSWATSCVNAGDQGAQRVTLEVTTRDAPKVTSRLVFVKRDTTCPVGFVESTC